MINTIDKIIATKYAEIEVLKNKRDNLIRKELQIKVLNQKLGDDFPEPHMNND